MIFVTATGTSVGKTFFCRLLLRFLRERGIKAGYQKWVSTGDADMPGDLGYCLGREVPAPGSPALELAAPCRFQRPLSPHLAAELEGREIDPETIIERCREMEKMYELLVVEGVGGVLVPLRRDLLLADLAARLRPETIVVAKTGLGTLNHTLLTLEALTNRKIPVLGVVFSDSDGPEEDETLAADNMRTIAEIGRVNVLGRLPHLPDPCMAERAFQPVGKAVLRLTVDG